MKRQHDHSGVSIQTPRRNEGIGYIDQAGARRVDGSPQEQRLYGSEQSRAPKNRGRSSNLDDESD